MSKSVVPAERMEEDLRELGLAPLMLTQEACRSLSISRSVLYEAIRCGRLRAYRRGGHRGPFLIRREDLAVWLVAFAAN